MTRRSQGYVEIMSILVNSETRVVVQGITGREGSFHTRRCVEYGTKVVAGVTPGKGGQFLDDNIPIFDSMDEAVAETGANTSLIFVPSPFVRDTIIEAASSGVELVVCITEGVPVLDTVAVTSYMDNGYARLIGPNCPGIISPAARCKVGIMPGAIHEPGPVGVVSRSGTLTYEAVSQLSQLGIGQSTCVGIGGDPVRGTSFVDVLKLFKDDSETDAIVIIGEIGGTGEQDAAAYISTEFDKPVASLVVGRTAPPGRRMGHAGAIITGRSASADEKIKSLRSAGAAIITNPGLIGETVKDLLGVADSQN